MWKCAFVPSRTISALLTFFGAFVFPAMLHADVRVDESFGKLPLHFEENRGQTHKDVRFVSRGPGYSVYLTAGEAVLVMAQPRPVALRMSLVGARAKPLVSGLDELPGKANYFVGRDPAKWRANVPTYAKVHYRQVYPGIDLVYYGNQRQLEYDFVVAPGADPKKIVLRFQGADKLEIDAQGDLVLHAAGAHLRQHKPIIYQEIDGVRREIEGGYVLKTGKRVGFQVAAYDRSRPLVIDPILYYSTYLGGNHDDFPTAIAVDVAGNAYVVGYTRWTGNGGGDSNNFTNSFPTTPGAFQTDPARTSTDVFVAKLNPTGSALVYSTYLGGNNLDEGFGIAVDASGNAYVTGYSASPDFPITPGAYQPAGSGVFVTKLDRTGSALVYSTYLGNGNNWGRTIALDADGNAYVTGVSSPTYVAGNFYPSFPTTPGAFQPTIGGGDDAFVTKLNSTGSALVYSTYLGGSAEDSGRGIAIDLQGNAYVMGTTKSANFPTTAGAFQPSFNGAVCPDNYRGPVPCPDVFVTKLNPVGSAVVYSTYLGGSGSDFGTGIAVDTQGHAYVTGTTDSSDFPTTAGAFQPAINDQYNDVFVTKLDLAGSALVYSTYLGSDGPDSSGGIAVDGAGNAYVAGGGASLTKLDPTGSTRLYADTLLNVGGASGIALDTSGNVYLAGVTNSREFRTTMGAYQSSHGYPWWSYDRNFWATNPDGYWWGFDGFIAKIAFDSIRTEEAAATYRGPWTTHGSEAGTFSNGTIAASDAAESAATFSFIGTAVSWIGVKCNVCGIATVSIDGGAPTTVNTAGPGTPGNLTSELVFAASGLAADVAHTITITVTDTTTSGGKYIAVDALEAARIVDVVPSTGRSEQPGTTRFEESDGTYLVSWTAYGSETGTFSGGTVVASDIPASIATFSFTGTALRWIGVKCNVCGIAAVSIDGGAPTTVNTAGPGVPGSLTSEPVFSVSGLVPDVSHTMTITVTGTTSSGGAHVAVDAFEVTR